MREILFLNGLVESTSGQWDDVVYDEEDQKDEESLPDLFDHL